MIRGVENTCGTCPSTAEPGRSRQSFRHDGPTARINDSDPAADLASDAERSRRSAQLVWADMPPGHVIRGLVVSTKSDPSKSILRVVTREVTEEEHELFGHDRICVTAPPLFSAEPIPIAPPPPPKQGELF